MHEWTRSSPLIRCSREPIQRFGIAGIRLSSVQVAPTDITLTYNTSGFCFFKCLIKIRHKGSVAESCTQRIIGTFFGQLLKSGVITHCLHSGSATMPRVVVLLSSRRQPKESESRDE